MLSTTYEEKIKVKEKEIESEEDCSVTSNRMDVKKLQDAEVFTYNGFMLPTKKNFSYITGSDALLQRKTIFQITSGSEAPDELLAVTNHGIDAGDVKKLQDAGIFTCNGLMMHTKKNFGYITGSDALLKRKTIFQITSGSEAPDELLAVTNHGIDAGDVKKLQDAGIFTCNGLMMHTKKNFGYITGSDALLKRKTVVLITTGSQALDELLAGGIETMAITEAFGEFRCGKTPLAHTLCVTTQLPISMKGVSVKVAYIETTGNFKGFAKQGGYDLLRDRIIQYQIAMNSTFIGDINSVDDYEYHVNPGFVKRVIAREEPIRVVWYKEPLEVKSREDMLHFATNLTFDRLYQIFGELVHKEEGPGFVEANREKDEAEALASFVRYYLEDRPVNLQELSDDLVQIFFDSEAGGLHQFLRPEEIGDENISHLMNSVTTFYARPPSDRWYSQIWEE